MGFVNNNNNNKRAENKAEGSETLWKNRCLSEREQLCLEERRVSVLLSIAGLSPPQLRLAKVLQE